MEATAIIQDILVYIDAHIQEEISIEVLAKRAGFSNWHFCRLFLQNVGYSVMGYIRKRRLAYAAVQLCTEQKIIDIALEYGFETHSGFSKAFRRQYGCSPEVYRLHAGVIRPLLPSLPNPEKYIGGIVMEPKLLTRPATKIAGYFIKTTTIDGKNSVDIPAFWGEYVADGRMNKLHSESFLQSHNEYGACFVNCPDGGELDYVIGVEVKGGAEVPPEYSVYEIPASTFAVFTSPPSDGAGFAAAIQDTWRYIFEEWLPNSEYEYAPGGVDYELYDERGMSETGKVCDIYIPVVKKD